MCAWVAAVAKTLHEQTLQIRALDLKDAP